MFSFVSASRRLQGALRARLLSAGGLPPSSSFLRMPALSPTMTQGSIGTWNLSEGQKFNPGDVLCEVETDKATVDFEAVEEGYLARILSQSGTKSIEVGTPIAITTEDQAQIDTIKKMNLLSVKNLKPSADSASAQPTVKTQPSNSKTESVHHTSAAGLRLSPAASSILHSSNVNMNELRINGSGKHGTVTKGDAIRALANGNLPRNEAKSCSAKLEPLVQSQVPAFQEKLIDVKHAGFEGRGKAEDYDSEFKDEETSTMRRVIAKRLTQVKQSSPHYYMSIACEVDEIMALRKRVKTDLGKVFSINDLIVLAVATTLRDVPGMHLNSTSNGEFSAPKSIDVSVAVATENGLITPIVKSADLKGLLAINEEIKDLAARARQNKLKLNEFQGGSFTVSNLGMFGVNHFTAVINEPQVGILAIGAVRSKLKPKVPSKGYIAGKRYKKGEVGVKQEMIVMLSFDRRAVDENTAGLFLQTFQHYMSKPYLLQM